MDKWSSAERWSCGAVAKRGVVIVFVRISPVIIGRISHLFATALY